MNPYWFYSPEYKVTKPISEYNNINLLSPTTIIEEYCDYFDLDDPAPNFSLPGVLNGEQINVSLDDFAGKWRVIFFYGSDFTFV